jgi:Protein of unknown function, DUF547
LGQSELREQLKIMRRWRLSLWVLVSVAAVGWWLFSRPRPRVISFKTGPVGVAVKPFSYDDYRAVLAAFVDSQGMVHYQALKANRQRLDMFAAALGTLTSAVYSNWSEKDQIAFWINAYNALTLEAIITHYPIRASLFRSALFPQNSIQQIPGVWDKLQFEVGGQKLALDHIEHQILRKQFNEPRIHMALVCAGKGCPPLRNEPYIGDRLDEQFTDQTKKFLAQQDKFRIDRSKGRVYLSPIFDWFGGDFLKTYGGKATPKAGRDTEEKAVLNFIAAHLEASDRDYLSTANYRVVYLDYDWSLNEQPTRSEIS